MANALQSYYAHASQPRQMESSDPSLMQRIAGNVLSPLAIAGNVLDLPGSTVRDVLAGENPFDQWMTPTTSENRTGGRDLLTRYGLTAPNDPHRWELSDLAGFGAELATDPLTFVSGIGRGLGTALRGTGKATDLFKVGVPFTGKSVGVNPFGATQMLDSAAKKVWDTDAGKAISTGMSGLFDYSKKGSFSPQGQKYASIATEMEEAAEPAARQLSLDMRKSLEPMKAAFHTDYDSVLQGAGKDADQSFRDLVTHAVELSSPKNLMSGKSYEDALERAALDLGLPSPTPAMRQAASGPLQGVADAFFKSHTANYQRGVKARYTPDKTGYFAREIDPEFLKSKGETGTGESLFSAPHMVHRDRVIGQVPKLYLNQLLDQKANRPVTAADVLNKAGEFLGYERRVKTKNGVKIKTVTPEKHAQLLADKINATSAKKFHSDDTFGAMDRYYRASSRIQANVDAVHKTFSDEKVLVPSGGVPLNKAFSQIGLDEKRAIDWYAKLNNKTRAEAYALQVDPTTVAAIAKVRKMTENPEWLGFVGKAMDSLNQMFKGSVTLPWLSYHLRNRMSGLHMNLASEHFSPTPQDVKRYAESWSEAAKAWKQGESSPVWQDALVHGMVPENFASEGVESLTKNRMSPAYLNPLKAVPEAYQQAGKYVADNPGGTWPMGLDQYLPNQVRQAMNTPMQWGSNAARATEFQNRLEMFIFLKKKGMTSAEAAKEVNKLQVDYSKITPFERNVVKRLVPFYGFQKGITPQIMAMLAERPGGGVAQTIRASVAGRDENTVTPPHIADSAAVPLGELADGTQRYLSNFGLAPEAALPYLTAPADMRGTALNALSSLTPLAKFPLELATGQTFFQRGPSGGRPLNQLDPSVGRTISNVTGADNPVNILGDRGWSRFAEHLLANSPASKLLTTARQLSDPRKDIGTKAVNTMLPFKITDVSPQQQERAINEASASLADELGARTWSNRYFPKEMIAAVQKTNPEAAAQMIALDNLMRKAKRDAKKFRDEKTAEKKKPARTESDKVVRELMRMAGV